MDSILLFVPVVQIDYFDDILAKCKKVLKESFYFCAPHAAVTKYNNCSRLPSWINGYLSDHLVYQRKKHSELDPTHRGVPDYHIAALAFGLNDGDCFFL